MQRFKLIPSQIFSGITSDTNSEIAGNLSNSSAQLQLVNNYYVYSTQIGGNVVNDNTVRDFLDNDNNTEIAVKFVNYLQATTTVEEFKEIFYNNKKLAYVFNDYYKQTKLITPAASVSVQERIAQSLESTSGISTYNTSFNPNTNNRNGALENLITTIPYTANSYYINISAVQSRNLAPRGDYSQYFQDCVKGVYKYDKYTYNNNIEINTTYGNSVYVAQIRDSLQLNYGYAPLDVNVNIEYLTPLFAGNGHGPATPAFTFYDFSQWKQYFYYKPKPININQGGFYISQDRILISNSNTFAPSNTTYYYATNTSYEAYFGVNDLTQLNKTSTGCTVPVTVKLSTPSIGKSYFFVVAETFSTASFGVDYSLSSFSPNSYNRNVVFQNGDSEVIFYMPVFSAITSDESIVLSLRNNSNDVLSYLVLRGEQMIPITTHSNTPQITIDQQFKNKVMLRCYVDLNFNDNESAKWHNNNIQIIDNRPIVYTDTVNERTALITPEFDLEKIIIYSNLTPKQVKNVYIYGSRLYGTFGKDSDYDVIIVADTPITFEKITKNKYQIQIYSVKKYLNDLANNEFPAVEFKFYPEWARLKEELKVNYPINIAKIKSSAKGEVERQLNLIKQVFDSSANTYMIKKMMFHTFRKVLYAIEIIKTGYLRDLQIAQNYYNFVFSKQFNSYEEFLKCYSTRLEELIKELDNTKREKL